MADPLTKSSKIEAIYARLLYLLDNGSTLKAGCEQIQEENSQLAATIRKQYQRRCTTPSEAHSNQMLTDKQENILVSMVVVYSAMHELLKAGDLQQHVLASFRIEVGKSWANYFLNWHKDAICKCKTKILASKRVDGAISEHVAEFIGQVETVAEVYPMKASNVVNYNKTRVFISEVGGIWLEHAGKVLKDLMEL